MQDDRQGVRNQRDNQEDGTGAQEGSPSAFHQPGAEDASSNEYGSSDDDQGGEVSP